MKQVSGIPRLNKQNSIKKRRKMHKNGEKEKAFVKVQKKKVWLILVFLTQQPIVLMKITGWKRLLLVLSTVITFFQCCNKSDVLKLKTSKYDQEILNRCNKKPWVYKEKSDVRSREISEMLQWKKRMNMQNLWQIFKKDMVFPRLSDHKTTI